MRCSGEKPHISQHAALHHAPRVDTDYTSQRPPRGRAQWSLRAGLRVSVGLLLPPAQLAPLALGQHGAEKDSEGEMSRSRPTAAGSGPHTARRDPRAASSA